MARTARITEGELQKALKLRDEAATVAEFRKAMSVILSAKLGLDAANAAELLGTSRSTLFRNRSKINNQDDTPKKSWGGRRRYSLSLEEERDFLASFEAEAGAGGVLSAPPIHVSVWGMTRLPQRRIACWPGTDGARFSRTPNIPKAIRPRKRSLKKTPGACGSRLPE